MNTTHELELTRAYAQSISSSRTTMNNMLNILVQQDRHMQNIIILSHNRRQHNVHRDTGNHVINFPNFSGFPNVTNDHPQSTQHVRQSRRGPAPSRGGGSSGRQSSNNVNHRRPTEAHRHPFDGSPYERNNVPYTTTRTSINRGGLSNDGLIHNRTMNLNAHPPWLTAALNNYDPLAPVVVRPTEAEIDIATEEIRYGIVTNPINNVCPITRSEFGDDDRVMQIVHCGHNFNPPSLRHWFQTNVRCPLCRYDIRDYDPIAAMRNPYSALRRRIEEDNADRQDNDERIAAGILSSIEQSDNNGTEGIAPISPQQERVLQVNVADRSNVISRISSFISQDIMEQIGNIPLDSSGNITLEYSFRNMTSLTADSDVSTDMSGNT